jgi:rubrerythrin
MPIVDVEPDDSRPPPYIARADEPATFEEEVAVAASTAKLLHHMGAPLEMDDDTVEKTKTLLDEAIKSRKSSNLTHYPTALAAAAFLQQYGQNLAFDVAATRAAVTNKLMELANCGEPKYELKALELLGKHSDIGIFTERSEITINYKNPEDLENAIKSRVKRLLNAQIVDVTPIQTSLDEELGVAKLTPEEDAKQDAKKEISDFIGEEKTPE